MGIVVFSIFVGGIIGMIYFLWYQKRVVKNIPNNMKGGINNAEDKNKEGGGESSRERARGESKRRWFRRRRKDPTTKIDVGLKHGVQVSNTNPNPKPKPKSKPKPREDRTNSKQDWPSFS